MTYYIVHIINNVFEIKCVGGKGDCISSKKLLYQESYLLDVGYSTVTVGFDRILQPTNASLFANVHCKINW